MRGRDVGPGAPPLRILAEVAAALADGAPVVALESSVLAQGLPEPANHEADRRMRAAVRERGAVPAVTAIVRGVPSVGLEEPDLARFLGRSGIVKVSARDLAWAMATGLDGATTVAASLALCTLAGVEVFATGGIGGVHRGAAWDESADLLELSRSPVITVCAGAKSILDLPATVERLETLGVSVIGYRTDEFPGFFTARTGLGVPAVAEHADEIALAYLAARALGRPGALLVVQAPPLRTALDAVLAEDAIAEAVRRAADEGIRGAELTPYLLGAVDKATGGRSVESNMALLEANAQLAAEVAVALSEAR